MCKKEYQEEGVFREIKIETHINKSPEEVWNVIADFPSYAKWNRFITKISQPDEKSLLVEFNSSKKVRMKLLKFNANDELCWRGELAGGWIFGGVHYLKVTKEQDGTLFTHGENFFGMLTWFSWPLLKKILYPIYADMNMALKEYVEKSKGK